MGFEGGHAKKKRLQRGAAPKKMKERGGGERGRAK